MKVNFNQTCASHAPILLEFLNTFKPKKVLEFGSGYFSTGLLLRHCSNLTSIEIQNFEWYQFLKEKLVNKSWDYSIVKDYQKAIDKISDSNRYRLIFVDSYPEKPRVSLVNFSFKHSTNVLVHDTQLYWTKGIEKPEKFKQFIFKLFPVKYKFKRKDAFEHRPWTTLFTSDKKVIEHFQKVKELDLYNKYKFPYEVKQ